MIKLRVINKKEYIKLLIELRGKRNKMVMTVSIKIFIIRLGPFKIKKVKKIFIIQENPFRIKS